MTIATLLCHVCHLILQRSDLGSAAVAVARKFRDDPPTDSRVLEHNKRSMASYRCSDFLIFRNLGFPLAVGFSDPLGLDPPGSLSLSNSKLGGVHFSTTLECAPPKHSFPLPHFN